jgi:hypothetical protein
MLSLSLIFLTPDSANVFSASVFSHSEVLMEGSEDLGPSEHDTTLLDDLDEEGAVVDGGEDAEEETGDATHLWSTIVPAIYISPLDLSFLRRIPVQLFYRMTRRRKTSGCETTCTFRAGKPYTIS